MADDDPQNLVFYRLLQVEGGLRDLTNRFDAFITSQIETARVQAKSAADDRNMVLNKMNQVLLAIVIATLTMAMTFYLTHTLTATSIKGASLPGGPDRIATPLYHENLSGGSNVTPTATISAPYE